MAPYGSKRYYRSSRIARMSVPRMMTGAAAAGAAAGSAYRAVKRRLSPGINDSQRSTQTTDSPRATQRAARSQRRGAGSRTGTRRSKYTKDSGNGADYSKMTATYGRRKKAVPRLLSLVKSNQERTIYAYRALNKVWGQAGYRYLKAVQTGFTGGNNPIELPCHVWDLTAVTNANGTTEVAPAVCHSLAFTNETATTGVQWNPLAGIMQNGSTSLLQYTVLNASNTTPARMEGGSAYLDWVNIKFLLYACKAAPTKVRIDVCQFTRDNLVPCPDDQRPLTESTPTTVSTTDHVSFWQQMMHKYVWNPILPANGRTTKAFKVLKSVTWECDPLETSETSNARTKEVNLYLKLGRTLNYRWKEDDLVGIPDQIESVYNVNQNQSRVAPRQRIFLMIRSLQPVILNASGTADYTNSVSYDVAITKCHVNFGPNI